MATPDLKKIFNKEFNESLVHQVTTDYLSNHRSGTKAQKNRSAVSGGGAKPVSYTHLTLPTIYSV